MKKIITCLLIISMLLSLGAMGISADSVTLNGQTKSQEIDVSASYVDNSTTPDSATISVDVEWGAMNFTYTVSGEKEWDPTKHEYKDTISGTWSAEGNTVTVTNHSDTTVSADFSYTAADGFGDISGTFDKDSVILATALYTSYEDAPNETVSLTLAGALASSVTESTKIGTVTVSIDGNENAENDGTLKYVLNSDNSSYCVIGLYDKTATNIDIPATYNNMPVTNIRAYAFDTCLTLKSVTISEGITSIGIYAFKNCENLEEMIIPDSVTRIEQSAFAYCYSMNSIRISNNLTVITDRMLDVCRGLTSLTIPKSVIEIEGHALSFCTGLTELVIPENITTLTNQPFFQCENLTVFYCEAAEKPVGWDDSWNIIQDSHDGTYTFATVYWGNEWEYVNGVPTLK